MMSLPKTRTLTQYTAIHFVVLCSFLFYTISCELRTRKKHVSIETTVSAGLKRVRRRANPFEQYNTRPENGKDIQSKRNSATHRTDRARGKRDAPGYGWFCFCRPA